MACALAAAFAMPVHAQTKSTEKQKPPSQVSAAMNSLQANAKEMNALVDKSKMQEAAAVYEKIVATLSDELKATEHNLLAAKGSKDEPYYDELKKKQSRIYEEVSALGNNLQTGKTKLSGYVDEFIQASTAVQ